MKKKFFKVLAIIFLVPVFLTGCITLVSSSQKDFSAVETDLSVWGFYGFVDKGRQNLKAEYEALRGTSKNGYDELYDYLDNQQPLYDVLRVGITAVDLKNQTSSQTGKEAYFEFDDMKDYQITRDGVSDQYTIKYKKSISYNNFPNRDFTVDQILERLYFNYDIKVAVGAVSSARDQSNISFRSYAVTEPSQTSLAEAKASFDRIVPGEDGRQTEYKLEHITESNYVEIKASKVETQNQDETLRYEKSIKLTRGTDISVKLSYYDGYETITKEKKLPVTNPIRGFTVNFNQTEGYLGWNITYGFGGEIKFSGESYFQGNKKFLLKEMFEVVNTNAMNFASSVINEIKFDGTDFAFKMLKGNTFTSIKTQNLLKIAVYDSEPQAYIFSKDKTDPVAKFQKYGG